MKRAAAVWTHSFPCGHRVFVGERVGVKTPVWCEECRRAYSEPCHRCNPCDICLARRQPAVLSRCMIVRLDPELNAAIEAFHQSASRGGRRHVALAEVCRDLLWRGVNEARRWRHPHGAPLEENPAQGKLFE